MTYSTNQHAEWLSLIEVSGPFLAEPILNQAFPQGLEKVDPVKKKQFRQTYDEWREVSDSDVLQDIQIKDKIHQEWVNWVLKIGLELDEDEDGDTLKNQSQMNGTIQVVVPEHHVTLKPEYVVIGDDENQPYMLVQTYPVGTALSEVLRGDGWSTSPAERMAHLCRGVGTRLGLITNGEQWMFIDAPVGGITTYASWFARLWGLEPLTLKAFYSLFNIKIVYSGFDDNKTLPQLVDESLTHQGDVTQALGSQVSRAVEVLIQSIDRINHDHNGELLEGVEPEELYEAGLTLMMRLVFLLCAEERGLLLLGDQAYEANYALSTLRAKLREEASLHGDEVLSYRKNAWARLLAIFRSVYAGVEHENMRMPALGGSLFDPDRFPFLEGRIKGSNWLEDEAKPLPIDNRTVLLFLDAIQLYKGRTLSYRALDVEQIGYVYEGLLEQTVKRAPDVTLELSGSKSCKKPWVYLGELASSSLDGDATLKKLLKERTASSPSRITNDLAKEITDGDMDKLMVACHNDAELCQRIKPYYHFLRTDAWNNPLVYPKDAYMLTTGSDRRETGSHYTPKSLTESIVTETLEPVVYIGPAEGKLREEWQLKSPEELLELKICDPAMGSGAFLVQVCRWLAERTCESWLIAEQSGSFVTAQGITTTDNSQELIPIDAEERLIIAKRLISERCLYGVDINPLAVELAKLSIWLVTLSKDRPFGFLDHNLKSGDSLLGIHNLDQLSYLNLNPSLTKKSRLVEQPFTKQIKELVEDTLKLRKQIATHDINFVSDIDEMSRLAEQAREKIMLPKLIGDAFIGLTLESKGKLKDTSVLSSYIQQAIAGDEESLDTLKGLANMGLSVDLPQKNKTRKALHWALEFPEVFISLSRGFDAIVGNPPFLGGVKISETSGVSYNDFLSVFHKTGKKVDLCAFFFRQSYLLLKTNSSLGLIATNSIAQGTTKTGGLTALLNMDATIYNAKKSFAWPGNASVITSSVNIYKGLWGGIKILNDVKVEYIQDMLIDGSVISPNKLDDNLGLCFQGSCPYGMGFFLTPDQASKVFEDNELNRKVVKPVFGGKEVNNILNQDITRYIIDFKEMDETEARQFNAPFSHLEIHLKPERMTRDIKKYPRLVNQWWKFWHSRQALYLKIKSENLNRVLVRSRISDHHMVDFLPSSSVFTDKLVIFTFDDYFHFGVLQSSLHDIWSRKYATTMKNDVSYVMANCFNTFPIPNENMTSKVYEIAEKYFCIRLKLKQQKKCGLTRLYNLFHSQEVVDSEIIEFREQSKLLDKAVLDLYGWSDIEIDTNFYVTDRGTRFTLSNEVKREVAKRLLDLNTEKE
jgi:hypothetical protein